MSSSISHLTFLDKPIDFSEVRGQDNLVDLSQIIVPIQDRISRKEVNFKNLKDEIFEIVNNPELMLDLDKITTDKIFSNLKNLYSLLKVNKNLLPFGTPNLDFLNQLKKAYDHKIRLDAL